LVIDFSGVDYLSSAGMAALCTVLLPSLDRGAAAAVCGLTEPVRLGLEVSGLLDRVLVSDTRQAAVQGLIDQKRK
jgi:anti-anti-sigma regulatory factor